MLLLLACSQTFEDPTHERPHRDSSKDSLYLDTSPLVIDDSGQHSGDSQADSQESGPPDSEITDIDRDGWPVATDCNDHDPASHPGATEVWYDGIDEDCLGGDDWDQDQDGQQVAPKGTDCNDTLASSYLGAAEVWYDGIDQDCAGDSDFDADKDGEDLGVDCDDGDASIHPGALETLGDASDADCDGDGDTSPAVALVQTGAQGLQGPRLVTDSTGTYLLVIADRLTIGGQPEVSVGARYLIDPSQLELGVIDSLDWSWGGAFSFDTGLGVWQDSRYMVVAYGLHDSANRYLVADVRDLSGNQWGTFSLATATPEPFADLEIASDGLGELQVLGCDNGPGTLSWAAGSPDEWFAGQSRAYDDLSGVVAASCAPRPLTDTLLVGAESLDTYTTLAGSLAYQSSETPNGTEMVRDIVVRGEAGELVGVAMAASGLALSLDGTEETLAGTEITNVDIAVNATHTLYALLVVDAGAARLLYGSPGAWTPVDLPTGMAQVDEVAVVLTDSGYLVWSARSGVELVVGSVLF